MKVLHSTIHVAVLLILLALTAQTTFSQIRKGLVRDNRTGNLRIYSRHEIIELGLLRPDDYDFATVNQLGVIGNSFDHEGKIGKAPADFDANIDSHFPITGFKQTICGPLHSYYIRGFCSGDRDDDVHFETRPFLTSRTLLDEVNLEILEANSKKHNGNTLPQVNLADDNSIDFYNKKAIEINNQILRLNVMDGKNRPYMRSVKTVVLGEIDVHEVYKSYLRKFSDNVPKQEVDCSCSYGPWIHDVGTGNINPGASFHDFLEIHPAEQVWWVNQQGNSLLYHLYLFNDNSGRFEKRENYDTDNGDLSFFGPWTPKKLDGTFAVAFSYKVGGPKMSFQLNRIASKNPLIKADGLKHYLIYKGDTLAEVEEPRDMDITDIRFEKVGLDPVALASSDSVIKGFLVIRNSVGQETNGNNINPELEGNIMLELIANNSMYQHSGALKRVIVSLDKIEGRTIADDEKKCEVLDGLAAAIIPCANSIYGYVGVKINSDRTSIKNISPLAAEGNNLLWSRQDNEGIPLRQGTIFYEMGSKTFLVDADAIVEIRSDLNEDNSNSSNNETLSDDGDDRLSKDGNIKVTTHKIADLRPGNPIRFSQSIYNEGKKTEVVLHFTITLLDHHINNETNKKATQ